MIASSSWDKTIKIWDISKLKLPEEEIYEVTDNTTLPQADQDIINTTFKNLEFEVNKAVIRPTSFPSLDNLAELLKKKTTYKTSLSGHTDNSGDANKNFKLSEQRAASVKQYLVSKGVDAARITATGYGATQPIASNLTEEGKQKNRRVEIQVEVK
jgi:OOP family OmpA-OmpF porin